MRFSIIIPVYNTEKYLDCCIKSVLKQKFRDFELILVNDGSTDESFQICQRYLQKDNRIKVFSKKNSGLSATRNFGIRQAKGEYVLFLDSDDYWLEDTLLYRLNDRIKQKESDVINFNFCKVVDGIKGEKYFTLNENMPQGLSEMECIKFIADKNIWVSSSWNKAVRRTIFSENNLYFREGINAEDIDWSVRLALAAKSFDYLNVIGLAYVQRQGSISHSMSLEKVDQLKENIIFSKQLIEEASDIKKIMLYPYLAYQIGVLLINVASLGKSDGKKRLKQSLSSLTHYLSFATDKRLKALNICVKWLGLGICFRLIKLIY